MDAATRNYLVVTGGYWAFTVTDGAIRMLVVLYFHLLGYSPFEVAMLFLFYEFFGIVTNLVGGWLGARIGLNLTMHIGMAMQVVALAALTVPEAWLSVPYVMAAQALSGIAKDLNKMSAKASVKTMVSQHGADRGRSAGTARLAGTGAQDWGDALPAGSDRTGRLDARRPSTHCLRRHNGTQGRTAWGDRDSRTRG